MDRSLLYGLFIVSLVSFIVTLFTVGTIIQPPDAIAHASIPLLAVSVDRDDAVIGGGIAYLELTIREGKGDVYVHAAPFTRVDTQATTKFAMQYACSFTQVDCSTYDFLYSIRADAPIVGGPSAGAATAALTIYLLEGKRFPSDVVITGSINSGGLIGSVGGIEEKVLAADRAGIARVIVPALSEYEDAQSGVDVIRVSTIHDVLFALDEGYVFVRAEDIRIPSEYTRTMRLVAQGLCDGLEPPMIANGSLAVREAMDAIGDLDESQKASRDAREYYTQASVCFNMRSRVYFLSLVDETQGYAEGGVLEYLDERLEAERERAVTLFGSFSRDDTLSSIQIYSIVQERFDESVNTIDRLRVLLSNFSGDHEAIMQDAGYAFARIDSMESWMRFQGYAADMVQVSNRSLRDGCAQKLSEAAERIEYVQYVTSRFSLDMSSVYDAYASGQYDACIYRASLLKARADTVLSSVGVTDDSLPTLIAAKNASAYDAIAFQSHNDRFPVMAYSYYEYAQSIVDDAPGVALLYLENAIELSGLDLYFPSRMHGAVPRMQDRGVFFFALGVLVSSTFMIIVIGSKRRKASSRNR